MSDTRLLEHIEAIESLEGTKAEINDDIKDRYSLAKGEGFDNATMRKVFALRKMDAAARQEADALLATYRAATGLD